MQFNIQKISFSSHILNTMKVLELLKHLSFLLISTTALPDQINLEPFSISGVTAKYKALGHSYNDSRFGTSKFHKPENPIMSSFKSQRAGSKGHAIINGEYMETERVLLQKTIPQGVAYFPYESTKTPIFIRAVRETDKKYIIFQDPFLPPGEGYFVVLKKIPFKASFQMDRLKMAGSQLPMPKEIAYEAFHLHLG